MLPVHDHSGIVFKTYSTRPDVGAFAKGVTAAATGAIRDAVIVLGRRAVVDIPTVVRMPSRLALVWKVKTAGAGVGAGHCLIGLMLYPLIGHVP